MKCVQSISAEAFKPFGRVIAFEEDCTEAFQIVVQEEKEPWRVATFRYTNKSIKVMENHPTSMETFEPVEGVTILMVAENATPHDYAIFILDRPVCLYKGIWHQVLALTPEAKVKITENLEVNSAFYTLEDEIVIAGCTREKTS